MIWAFALALGLAAPPPAAPAPPAAAAPRAPPPAPTPSPPMNCSTGFAELSRSITAEPGIGRRPPVAGAPDVYSSTTTPTMYFISTPGVVGHPIVVRLIMKEVGTGTFVEPSGCAYGDQAGTTAFMQNIAGMLSGVGGVQARPAQP